MLMAFFKVANMAKKIQWSNGVEPWCKRFAKD